MGNVFIDGEVQVSAAGESRCGLLTCRICRVDRGPAAVDASPRSPPLLTPGTSSIWLRILRTNVWELDYTRLHLHFTTGIGSGLYQTREHVVELQRQFLALRRAGALPLQAWLERRGLGSCALPTHRELPFVYNWGVRSTLLFYQIKSLCNCTSAAPEPLVPQPKRSTHVH